MAFQNSWGTPQGGPAPLPPIPARELRPRRIWYVIGALLGVVLAGAGVVFLVVAVKDTVHSIDDTRTLPNGVTREFSFVRGETREIYVSQSGRGRVDCRIPQMPPGALTQPSTRYRITLDSRSWVRVFEVRPTDSGTYAVLCNSGLPEAEFALGGAPHVAATVGGIFAAVGCFLAAIASVLTICLVTGFRRAGHRRRLAAARAPAPQWGAGPQWGPVPPAGPWGQPPSGHAPEQPPHPQR
ncbi:serine/arginine repetitive matrix protein 2 [Streptomyces sp. NPDC048664]|uniref:serine/arginine repetitive matrix protein 2 n=1 Tax=Streptomyces sp. NPDC048664 TaxID=3154505 RepID=UPI00341CA8E8